MSTPLEFPDVIQIPGWGYGVPSLSHPGYLAVVSGKDCTCPAGQKGARACRHRKAVDEYVRARNEQHKRPVAPPHINALVGEP